MDSDGVEPNPGLGFRPQITPDNDLILVNEDYKTPVTFLELFLQTYYGEHKNDTFTGAHSQKVTFNYEQIIKDTPCAREKSFGYATGMPCVVLKLNRIFGWLPKSGPTADYPFSVAKTMTNSPEKFVFVHCTGEGSNDMDNLGEIEYYSTYTSKNVGGISFKYFPFRNQPDYLSPLVFAHFKNVSRHTLVNVECRAYAKNIDNTDRRNRRGMVRFQLYVTK